VQFMVVVHEVQFSKFLQKETDAGARGADHVSRRVRRIFGMTSSTVRMHCSAFLVSSFQT
jgi:hypothetical protein